MRTTLDIDGRCECTTRLRHPKLILFITMIIHSSKKVHGNGEVLLYGFLFVEDTKAILKGGPHAGFHRFGAAHQLLKTGLMACLGGKA